jgi:hypothetical protein
MAPQRIGLALTSLLVWVAPATADVIYQYTGHPFTDVVSPYTTADFVSGTLQVSTKLPPNQQDIDFTGPQPGEPMLDAYTFSDGQQTFTQNNSHFNNAFVSTDSTGQITAWMLDFATGSADIDTDNEPAVVGPGVVRDVGTQEMDVGSVFGQVLGNPGTWTLVPEPSTVTLFALGLSLLATATRRKKA